MVYLKTSVGPETKTGNSYGVILRVFGVMRTKIEVRFGYVWGSYTPGITMDLQ